MKKTVPTKQERSTQEYIRLRGVRVNNLKNIDLDIPLGKLVVVTGLSGSGKSSLAFDTLYAEGQRRYVESLSAYARQFLGRMHKPDCDTIKGLPPAIAIEQKVTSRNPRSTVGTSTEIYDYLRMLFARIGKTVSPVSGAVVKKHSVDDVVNQMLFYSRGTRLTLLAPIVLRHERTLGEQLSLLLKQGISRLDLDGTMIHIDDALQDADKMEQLAKAHAEGKLFLLIDRLVSDDAPDMLNRFRDSVETAFYEGDGECLLRFYPSGALYRFSERFEADGMTFEEPSDQMFSFNSPAGACPECEGFGSIIGIDEHLVVPDTSRSVYDGAVVCWRGEKMGEWKNWFIRLNADRGFPIFKPYFELTQEEKDWLWHGTFPASVPKEKQQLTPEEQEWGLVCIDAFFQMLRENQYKIQYRVMLARYRGKTLCPTCHGSRLKKSANYVYVGGRTLPELVRMPISELRKFFGALQVSENEKKLAERLLNEINSRLGFLDEVGLAYLTLDRLSNSLSGGESQRINLATSLGSSLVGSLYILDEPSIGLHSRDTANLIRVLKNLRDVGNTVIVVEHDEEIMRAADYIIDIGPEAGRLGGEVVFAGEPDPEKQKGKTSASHTLNYLLGTEQIPVPPSRRSWNTYIDVKGCRANNLKGIDVRVPLNVMVVVTGVSGSGKSTFVRSILYNALMRRMDRVADRPGEYKELGGNLDNLSGVEFVDQNPIGKSTRSNPVTYVKAWDEIRKLMADQPLAKQMEMSPAWFSFNADGGRCEECKGEGTVKVEMQFMADLVLECDTCHGKRFKNDVLSVKFHDKNVYDILEMTVNQAIEFFSQHGQKRIIAKLKPLQDVGLGYIKLGQSSSTLSGGENQRVKLAYYLSLERTDPTLFIFDEPTTGLHFHDISKLLDSFNALIERGHSLLIIEHNMEIIKSADYIIDLGPEGGAAGGFLVATGTPEEIVAQGKGYTAKALKEKL